MIDSIPPGMLLIVGALLLSVLRGKFQQVMLLVLPVLSGLILLGQAQNATSWENMVGFSFFNLDIILIRIDKLSLVWGTIFHIAVFLCAIFSLHVKDTLQHVAGYIYAGAAIGAVFAGDLLTLFVYWELTAVSSVFLIWASRRDSAFHAGMRYLIIQVGSGVLLLSGVLLRLHTSDLEQPLFFGKLSLQDPGSLLILLSFGIKAAFPLLHNWLQDAYPQATPTGTVFLSAFTTKLAIYALARGFPGTEQLIWLGAAMTVFPIFFAVIENDLRRVLAYSLNNQLGFMVVGIGVGTPLALNGTAAHAFCHILYKSLLYMTMGAVLFRTGTMKGNELGGLYKSMPWTTFFCIIGGASISAFPLFSGFVSKSLIMSATAENHHGMVWLILLFASAGVLEHSGIKIPFVTFFAHDNGLRVKEAPVNMLVAMGVTAFLCVLIGIFPGPLYALLPYDVVYEPYTAAHVINQLQLLLFAILAFAVLQQTGLYPSELPKINLDTDWFYRRALPNLVTVCCVQTAPMLKTIDAGFVLFREWLLSLMYALFGPTGLLGRKWSTGGMALWAAILLGVYLVLYYL
ncbi:MAG: Na(+)/H(+) antiporter subunit D [Planctomycetes bacterium]|nr:Na(+)/H(+) antiporter subunit D [Planctomycetota bacterium]